MSYGTPRFYADDKVDVRTSKPGQPAVWTAGARFSHYNARGHAVVEWDNHVIETIPDLTALRLSGPGAKEP